MTAFTAQLKPFSLFLVCVTFIAALAASLRPAAATDVTVPKAQAVPVAPAAHVATRTEAAPSALAAVPQPRPVPEAPAVPLAENPHPAEHALSVPAAGSALPLVGLAFAATLLVTAALVMRRTGPRLRTAVC
jgi:hypothetical protein